MSNQLAGKVALVTGGSRGIGAATRASAGDRWRDRRLQHTASEDRAKALAAEVEKAGGTALAIKADSADVDAVQAAVAQTADRFGRIDILVNNAGILIGGAADGYDILDFDRMIAVNVRAVFVYVQAALPHMGEGGRIITTGSVTADRSGFAGSSVYSMTLLPQLDREPRTQYPSRVRFARELSRTEEAPTP
jgi:3-oxoacyl-[acyl-carrier protein] reductase